MVSRFRYDMGGKVYLDVYSIDPEIREGDLEKTVKSSLLSTKHKSPVDLVELSNQIEHIGTYSSFAGVNFQASFDKYSVPEQLRPYRDAIKLKFNNSIIVFRDGKVFAPPNIIKGEYRDFISTHLKKVPAQLVPEKYPAGKTIAELLPEWGLSRDSVAKYLAIVHRLSPSNGKEITFVYRNEKVHIAPNCIALSGSTPEFPDNFNHERFSWDDYFKEHIAKEMEEEYCLSKNEISLGKLHFLNDVEEIPMIIVEINTPLSTMQLAEKSYDQPKPKEEHSIFFSVKKEDTKKMLDVFDLHPPTARAIDLIRSH